MASTDDMASLIATGSAPESKGNWNGMLVYAADPKTGKVLIDAGAEVKHESASLTKMMTFYLALEAMKEGKIKPDQTITITRHDTAATKPYTNVIKGEKLTMKEALGAMMTASDNGVAVAVSEAVGGDFVKAMNAKAKEIGMSDDTHFYNVNGLPDIAHPHSKAQNNTTTARDMATLITRLAKDFPEATQEDMGQGSVKYGTRHKPYPAHHFLNAPDSPLRLPTGYDAIAKTGYTEGAHHNIASMITGPDGKELTVVVLGAEWSGPEKAKAVGMPDAIVPKPGQEIIGSAVRDALVRNITGTLLAKDARSMEVSVAPEQKESLLSVLIPAAEASELPATGQFPHIRYRVQKPEAKQTQNPPAHREGTPKRPHVKSAAELVLPEIPLTGDHQALLADARRQFDDALKSGGTPSAPAGKSGGGLELG